MLLFTSLVTALCQPALRTCGRGLNGDPGSGLLLPSQVGRGGLARVPWGAEAGKYTESFTYTSLLQAPPKKGRGARLSGYYQPRPFACCTTMGRLGQGRWGHIGLMVTATKVIGPPLLSLCPGRIA
jgi:hypothetical protein